eukprot:364238-Chlamydomonas_euryale.AAC.3
MMQKEAYSVKGAAKPNKGIGLLDGAKAQIKLQSGAAKRSRRRTSTCGQEVPQCGQEVPQKNINVQTDRLVRRSSVRVFHPKIWCAEALIGSNVTRLEALIGSCKATPRHMQICLNHLPRGHLSLFGHLPGERNERVEQLECDIVDMKHIFQQQLVVCVDQINAGAAELSALRRAAAAAEPSAEAALVGCGRGGGGGDVGAYSDGQARLGPFVSVTGWAPSCDQPTAHVWNLQRFTNPAALPIALQRHRPCCAPAQTLLRASTGPLVHHFQPCFAPTLISTSPVAHQPWRRYGKGSASLWPQTAGASVDLHRKRLSGSFS